MADEIKRMRGARLSPRHVLAAATPHKIRATIPASIYFMPEKLNDEGNNQYGDCVSAEEAASRSYYSVMCGQPEITTSRDLVIQWANRHGYLNGADLHEVVVSMEQDGMQADDGKTYKDGPVTSVDWTKPDTLQSALSVGPVKIAVSAGQFEQVHTNQNGWLALDFGQDYNIDHCVGVWNYDTLGNLADRMKVLLPGSVDKGQPAYNLYTWSSAGIITQKSLNN